MKRNRFLIIGIIIIIITSLSGCNVIDEGMVKLNLKNNDFEYIKESKVDKIIIQSTRDSGFKFVISDSNAINDIYSILSKGKVKDEKTSLDPDYNLEVYIGDEVKLYKYVVSVDERGVGNFYDDNTSYLIPKDLDDTIQQNLSTIRKPRDFENIYYNSILEVVDKEKDVLTSSDNKVGININGDVDCLKYIFSVDIKSFEKKLDKIIPGAKLINNNESDYDTVITVKNRGYSTKIFKTAIVVDNKKDKSYETYYVQGSYEDKTWKITVSQPNEKPKDW